MFHFICGPLLPLASARQPSFFTPFKSEGWSGREDLNLRLPAPKATRLDFKGLKPLKIKTSVCAGCGYLLWF
jgi:hypothetical protein